MKLKLPHIILVSQSSTRKELLARLGLAFSTTVAHDVERDWRPKEEPASYAIKQACRKVHSKRYLQSNRVLLVGVDTVVWCHDKVIGKPKDRDHQRRMICELCGGWHQIYSGISLLEVNGKGDSIKEKIFSCMTSVEVGVPAASVIDDYIDSGEGLNKAGGYGIQDILGLVMIRQIKGNYHNVMGFPLYLIYHILHKLYQR